MAAYLRDGRAGLAAIDGSKPFHGLTLEDPRSRGDRYKLLRRGGEALVEIGYLLLDTGAPIDTDDVTPMSLLTGCG
ncbi:hypothetical protein [Lichenicoccus sp.]|uniref:hypothetical protein n=1 Tax=Lichenicoccus sp. TaxID=2781899 RepID=UPI003D138AE4